MENIKKRNILLRLWDRLGQADIDDNEYEGVSAETKAELTKRISALDMLSSNAGGKKSSSARKDENVKLIENSERVQTKRVERHKSEGFERE